MSNKHIDRIFKKSKAKLIALPVVAVICVALIVVVNVVLNMFATILHRVFAGDGVDVSGSAGVLEEADKVVRNTAEESITKINIFRKRTLQKSTSSVGAQPITVSF